MYLNNCENLTSLPEDLTIAADLDLSGCISIVSLPSWITQLGCRLDGSRRLIVIRGTGLPDTILDQLLQIFHICIDFRIYRRRKGEETKFPHWDAALRFWKETAQIKEEDCHFLFTT